MASDDPTYSSSPPSPMEIRRTLSQNTAASGASVPGGRRTGQQRINDILQVATQRAESMDLRGVSTMSPERLSSLPRDEPDERTNIIPARNTIDYQTTHASSAASVRSRQPYSRPDQNTGVGNGSAIPHVEKHQNWLQSYLDGVWSIELENKGSVARDHLAVERTFLAWLRTSLAFASIGVAVTQLFRLDASLVDEPTQHRLRRLGGPLGTTFIGISILVLLLGYHRFYQPQQWLLRGKFPASRGAIILISFLSFALMLASLLIVVILQPHND